MDFYFYDEEMLHSYLLWMGSVFEGTDPHSCNPDEVLDHLATYSGPSVLIRSTS